MQVKWDYNEFIGDPRNNNSLCNMNQGILLVLGFVPGLKVDAIPLFHPHQVYMAQRSKDSSFACLFLFLRSKS